MKMKLTNLIILLLLSIQVMAISIDTESEETIDVIIEPFEISEEIEFMFNEPMIEDLSNEGNTYNENNDPIWKIILLSLLIFLGFILTYVIMENERWKHTYI